MAEVNDLDAYLRTLPALEASRGFTDRVLEARLGGMAKARDDDMFDRGRRSARLTTIVVTVLFSITLLVIVALHTVNLETVVRGFGDKSVFRVNDLKTLNRLTLTTSLTGNHVAVAGVIIDAKPQTEVRATPELPVASTSATFSVPKGGAFVATAAAPIGLRTPFATLLLQSGSALDVVVSDDTLTLNIHSGDIAVVHPNGEKPRGAAVIDRYLPLGETVLHHDAKP